jgi:cell division protein FtsB
LRSEAKLEQLRARVKTQADEIAMLRDFNQSLMQHIEKLEAKDKPEEQIEEQETQRPRQESDATLQEAPDPA